LNRIGVVSARAPGADADPRAAKANNAPKTAITARPDLVASPMINNSPDSRRAATRAFEPIQTKATFQIS
jgi:hypothetical protein